MSKWTLIVEFGDGVDDDEAIRNVEAEIERQGGWLLDWEKTRERE